MQTILENRLLLGLFIASISFACGTTENSAPGGGTGGSGAVGGSGGSGGTGAAGGTGGVISGDCEEDADCSMDEFCVILEGATRCKQLCQELGSSVECVREGEICIQIDDPRGGLAVCHRDETSGECEVDEDCPEGSCTQGFCSSSAECSRDSDCDAAEICRSGSCIVPGAGSCVTTADCIEQTAYCADLGTGSSCVDVACGGALNNCNRCNLGPNGGDRAPAAPVIFYPEQIDGCVQDPNLCLPGAAPFSCTFGFYAFGGEGGLPTVELDGRIRILNSTGSELTVFGASSSPQGSNRQYVFQACFRETASGNIGTAVLLRDAAGQPSNSLCIDGQL